MSFPLVCFQIERCEENKTDKSNSDVQQHNSCSLITWRAVITGKVGRNLARPTFGLKIFTNFKFIINGRGT